MAYQPTLKDFRGKQDQPLSSGVRLPGKSALAALLLLGSGAAQAEILYVNGAVAQSGDGSSWSKACKYLRDALDHSSSGDNIYVAGGTYYPDEGKSGLFGDREMAFELDGQKIYGGFGGTESRLDQRDPQANPTILSGAIWDQKGEDIFWSLHVVVLNQSSTLDGIIVEKGHASGADSWNYPSISSYDEGGGCYVRAGKTLTLSGCTFRNNRALANGGAIMVEGDKGKVVATNCLFDQNEIPLIYSITTSIPEGGAIKGNVEATQCRFTSNTVEAENYLGGTSSSAAGGAISGNTTAVDCQFVGNTVNALGDEEVTSEATGGAISGNILATRCSFTGNSAKADDGTGISSGGAVSGGSVSATNCSFSGNISGTGTIEDDGSGKGGGGAVYLSDGKSVLANCIFVSNTSGVRGGAIHSATSTFSDSLVVANCTFLDNGVADGFKGSALSCGGIVRVLNNIFWYGSASAGGFNRDNLIHVILDGALRNSNVNYLTPATAAANVVKGGTDAITRGEGGDIFLAAVSNTIVTGDPLFVASADPDGADDTWGTTDDGLRLTAGSSAIGISWDPRIIPFNNILPKDVLDIDGDGDVSEPLPLDNTGFVRIQNSIVDMGAYESGPLQQSPEISVSLGGDELSDGGSNSYGPVEAYKGKTKTFIIKNVGTGVLKNIAVSMKGSAIFKLQKTDVASLSPGKSAKFTVSFVPTDKLGMKTAKLTIGSNDVDENPFDISLSATGVIGKNTSRPTGFANAATPISSLAQPANDQSSVSITTVTLSNGSKYIMLTVQKLAGSFSEDSVVEVSSNLLDWYSGSNHTTTLVDSPTLLRVRDNLPIKQGEKRFIRLR